MMSEAMDRRLPLGSDLPFPCTVSSACGVTAIIGNYNRCVISQKTSICTLRTYQMRNFLPT